MTTNSGHQTPLPSHHRSGDAMNLPITDRLVASPASSPLGATGADVAERDPSETVAANPPVVDAEHDPSYRHDVEHVRQSRLSRWQEQRIPFRAESPTPRRGGKLTTA